MSTSRFPGELERHQHDVAIRVFGLCPNEYCDDGWVTQANRRRAACMVCEKRLAEWLGSPPPQPATTRLAAEADDADARMVEWRERALAAEALVREKDVAIGELLTFVEWLDDERLYQYQQRRALEAVRP